MKSFQRLAGIVLERMSERLGPELAQVAVHIDKRPDEPTRLAVIAECGEGMSPYGIITSSNTGPQPFRIVLFRDMHVADHDMPSQVAYELRRTMAYLLSEAFDSDAQEADRSGNFIGVRVGMSLKRFGNIVARIMETLPGEIARHLGNIVVDVEDDPDPDVLRKSGCSEDEIRKGISLYGLFSPLGADESLPEEDDPEPNAHFFDSLDQPNRLIIFRNPHLRDFPDRKQLMIEIRKTVIHEIAHHFGYTDKDLERFDNTDNPFGDE